MRPNDEETEKERITDKGLRNLGWNPIYNGQDDLGQGILDWAVIHNYTTSDKEESIERVFFLWRFWEPHYTITVKHRFNGREKEMTLFNGRLYSASELGWLMDRLGVKSE
jgi:hypothetical protein